MKPVFGVTFRPDCPIDAAFFEPITIQTPGGPCQSIRCSEVRETSFGFLQLVPVPGSKSHTLTLFVPPSYVLYMLRAEDDSSIGFLPAASKATAQSDQAG